jgi:hypothetical protein
MEQWTYCPYCDSRIFPGQEVAGVDDPDLHRSLLHAECFKMRQHDDRLAAKMSGKSEPV